MTSLYTETAEELSTCQSHFFENEFMTRSSSTHSSFSEKSVPYIQSFGFAEPTSSSKLFESTLSSLLSQVQLTSSTQVFESYSSELDALVNYKDWVKGFYSEASTLDSVKKLAPYYKNIQSLVINKEFDQCDTFLRHVRTKSLTDVLLVGLLRLTYSKKENLSSWEDLMKKVSDELTDRGLDKAKLLKGII